MSSTVHRSSVGVYHPNPKDEVQWTAFRVVDIDNEEELCDSCGEELTRYSLHFYRLDGANVLCPVCARVEGIRVVDCDCE